MNDESMHTQQMHDWIDRMRAGDPDAVEELLRAACRRMEHLARRMLKNFPNVNRWVQTDDVLQNALIRLLRSLEKLKPDSIRAFYGLAGQEIRRELLDLARHYNGPRGLGANHKSHFIQKGESEVENFDPPDPAGSGDSELEKWSHFHEEVEKLPAELREVVSLVFYHGWTQEEVAELFGVHERTIRRRWQEALLLLRKTLKDQLPA